MQNENNNSPNSIPYSIWDTRTENHPRLKQKSNDSQKRTNQQK